MQKYEDIKNFEEFKKDTVDLLENIVIALDMRWDMEDLRECAVELCKAAGSKIFDPPEEI